MSPPASDPLAPLIFEIETRVGADVLARAAGIEFVFLDVDGVMTDGTLDQGDDALERKRFHARDTIGARLLVRGGLRLAIVSGRASNTLTQRARELGIDEVHQGIDVKLDVVERIARDADLALEKCAFVGDDVVDLPSMRRVGLALCPLDAHVLVRSSAHHVLSRRGGDAALREAAELVLHARGKLRETHARYLG